MPSVAEPAVLDVGPGLLLLLAPAAVAQLARASVPWQYRPLFVAAAQRFKGQKSNENLLHALAWHESGMDPNAVGPPNHDGTRDYGLMQINERNFAALGVTASNWNDPAVSIQAAAQLLASIEEAQPGLSLHDIISIYNAGPSSEHPGAKRSAEGGYVDAPYVFAVWGKLEAIQLAALAPLQG